MRNWCCNLHVRLWEREDMICQLEQLLSLLEVLQIYIYVAKRYIFQCKLNPPSSYNMVARLVEGGDSKSPCCLSYSPYSLKWKHVLQSCSTGRFKPSSVLIWCYFSSRQTFLSFFIWRHSKLFNSLSSHGTKKSCIAVKLWYLSSHSSDLEEPSYSHYSRWSGGGLLTDK